MFLIPTRISSIELFDFECVIDKLIAFSSNRKRKYPPKTNTHKNLAYRIKAYVMTYHAINGVSIDGKKNKSQNHTSIKICIVIGNENKSLKMFFFLYFFFFGILFHSMQGNNIIYGIELSFSVRPRKVSTYFMYIVGPPPHSNRFHYGITNLLFVVLKM